MSRTSLRIASFLLLATMLFAFRAAVGVVAQEGTPDAGATADCPTTTAEENAAIARRWHEDAVNGHDLAILDEILAPTIMHDSATFPDNPGPQVVLGALLTGFPDVMQTVDDLVAEGDLVAIRWTATGTHQGEFQGYAATGNAATWTGINLFRIECGRIAEVWTEVDGLGRLQQIGAMPAMSGEAMAEPADTAATTPESCPTTTAEENKALARRWWDEVWSGGNVDALDELLAAGHLHHWAVGPDTTGGAPIKDRVAMWRATFPDLAVTVDDIIADGDLVAARWTATGTDQGGFQGAAPTGQAVEWSGINVFRIECGQIVEIWSEMDTLGLFDQLGLMDDMMAMATPEP